MAKIKSIRQKTSNATFGAEIPLGADAENVDVMRLDEKGNAVVYPLSQIIEELYNLPSVSSELFWDDLPNS